MKYKNKAKKIVKGLIIPGVPFLPFTTHYDSRMTIL